MRSHGGKLRHRARRYSSSSEDAEDALADACVAFLRHFDESREDSAVPWMMTTVKHAALHIVKYDKVRRRRDAHALSNASDAWWHLVADEVSDDRQESLRWALERADLLGALKPDERTALTLYGFGLSYREISERQGWSMTKVNRCMAEGRIRLRHLVSQAGGEER